MRDLSRVVFTIARADGRSLRPVGTGFLVRGRSMVTSSAVVGEDGEGLVAIVRGPFGLLDHQPIPTSKVEAAPLKVQIADSVSGLAVLSLEAELTFKPKIAWADENASEAGNDVVILGSWRAPNGSVVLTQRSTHIAARILVEADGRSLQHVLLGSPVRDLERGAPVFEAQQGKLLGVVASARGVAVTPGVGDQEPGALTAAIHAGHVLPFLSD